jgi:hypothetical protein
MDGLQLKHGMRRIISTLTGSRNVDRKRAKRPTSLSGGASKKRRSSLFSNKKRKKVMIGEKREQGQAKIKL